MDSFTVLNSPVGANINGPGTCTWYSEVNDDEFYVLHNKKMNDWDSLIDDPEHLRFIKKKSIVPSWETMLYVQNIGRFHGPRFILLLQI